jgi:hypothetical protein
MTHEEMLDEAARREEENEWIDGAFKAVKTRFLWKSVLKEGNKDCIFGLTEGAVISSTRWYLKSLQDGTWNETARVVNDGVVGGKL